MQYGYYSDGGVPQITGQEVNIRGQLKVFGPAVSPAKISPTGFLRILPALGVIVMWGF